ncbi:MAG: carboxylesterase family protein, partial [Chloroflexi bacterium]|nr:carboxylesterase family protein [Chloroflexota bacterium]
MQTFVSGLELLGAWEMPVDEDCLTLNIWTPGLDDAKRPVMFWIHGGGFAGGSGATPIYNGQHLASRGDVVVVTINYRLGALGYLYNQALTDGDDPTSGNYGMRDQIAALEWVRDHIRAFSGDPDNVTIFGESAGGMSVGVLMGAAEAEGLFHRAIPQSGAAHHSLPIDIAEEVCRRYCAILEVSPEDADSLRSIPAQDMLDAQNALAADPQTSALTGRYLMAFSPVVEGGFLETLPIESVRNGRSKDVDLLCGTIEDEWTLLAAIQGVNEMDETSARGALAVTAGDADVANQLYDHYRDA